MRATLTAPAAARRRPAPSLSPLKSSLESTISAGGSAVPSMHRLLPCGWPAGTGRVACRLDTFLLFYGRPFPVLAWRLNALLPREDRSIMTLLNQAGAERLKEGYL